MPASDGILTLDDPPLRIDPRADARTLGEQLTAHGAAMRLEGPRTRFTLEDCAIAGRRFRIEVCFTGPRLDALDLFLHQPTDKGGWESWTAAGEAARKAAGEAWAQETFGRPMEVKSFELDGRQIVPFTVTWETARRLLFPWGEVISYFDSKAGFAGLGIHYTS